MNNLISPRHVHLHIGPILDDRLKDKLLKSLNGVFCIHFRVCLSACLPVCLSAHNQATEHTFWPRNQIFGLDDPW